MELSCETTFSKSFSLRIDQTTTTSTRDSNNIFKHYCAAAAVIAVVLSVLFVMQWLYFKGEKKDPSTTISPVSESTVQASTFATTIQSIKPSGFGKNISSCANITCDPNEISHSVEETTSSMKN